MLSAYWSSCGKKEDSENCRWNYGAVGVTSKMSLIRKSSAMLALRAFHCCAPDLFSLYIASRVRRILTWVTPLSSVYSPGLMCAPAIIVAILFLLTLLLSPGLVTRPTHV